MSRTFAASLPPHVPPFFSTKYGRIPPSQAVPMFHGMGMTMTAWAVRWFVTRECMQFIRCWQASCGLVLTTAKPQSPTIPLSPENVYKGALDTKSEIIFCAPIFLEVWFHAFETRPELMSNGTDLVQKS
jgi:hypothetical protein